METMIPFLLFIAGAINILVAFNGLKSKSLLTKKQIIPLIVAIIFAFLGTIIFSMSNQIVITAIVLLIGLVAPIIYLIKMKISNGG